MINCLAPFTLLLAGGEVLVPREEEWARLIPASATVVVRLESARAWNQFVHAFAPVAGEEASGYDLQRVLDEMDERLPDEGPAPVIDPERPLYVALSLSPDSPPAYTLVAPVTNGASFRFFHELAGGQGKNVTLGGYTGISSLPDYAVGTEPNELVAGLAPGLVSVHVDLRTIIRAYRPLIDTGLRQAEMMFDSLSNEGPMDIQPIMELYMEWARAFMNTARSVDAVLEREGDELFLNVNYEGKGSARIFETTDALELMGYVDPSSSVQVLYNGNWSDYLACFDDLLDAVLDVYPEPIRTDLGDILALQRELAPLLAPGVAMGMEFGERGIRGSYVLRSTDAARLQGELERLLATFDRDGRVVRVGEARELVLGGHTARVLPLEINYRVFSEALTTDTRSEHLRESMLSIEGVLAAVYGRDLRVALAHSGDLLLVALGQDDEELRAAFARLDRPELPAERMRALSARIPSNGLGFAQHFDLGSAMERWLEAMGETLPGVMIPASFARLSFDMWAWQHGEGWSGGVALRLSELLELFDSGAPPEKR